MKNEEYWDDDEYWEGQPLESCPKCGRWYDDIGYDLQWCHKCGWDEEKQEWGANHFISKIPFDSPCWIVWDKDNGNNDFADCELAWTSFSYAVRKFKYKWHGMLQENMKNKEIRIHPTQKPVALYKWLLTSYAKPGMRILDTHGGSMSHAIAAHDLGFDLTII